MRLNQFIERNLPIVKTIVGRMSIESYPDGASHRAMYQFKIPDANAVKNRQKHPIVHRVHPFNMDQEQLFGISLPYQ